MQREDKEKGDTTDTQFSSSIWKQMRDTALPVEMRDFEIDLRIDRVPQGAILKDEEQMKEINGKVEKLNNRFMHKMHEQITWRKRVI